jgi:hypothetical protein
MLNIELRWKRCWTVTKESPFLKNCSTANTWCSMCHGYWNCIVWAVRQLTPNVINRTPAEYQPSGKHAFPVLNPVLLFTNTTCIQPFPAYTHYLPTQDITYHDTVLGKERRKGERFTIQILPEGQCAPRFTRFSSVPPDKWLNSILTLSTPM